MAQLNNLIVTGASKFLNTIQGTASSADMLTTSAGGAGTPVYFSNGKPVACTLSNVTVGNATNASCAEEPKFVMTFTQHGSDTTASCDKTVGEVRTWYEAHGVKGMYSILHYDDAVDPTYYNTCNIQWYANSGEPYLDIAFADCGNSLGSGFRTITMDMSSTASNTTTAYASDILYSLKYHVHSTADITSFSSAVQGITVNNATNAAKVGGKAFGSAATCNSSAFAASSHGLHVPATVAHSNKKFLRSDNSWADVTPANIGASATGHTHTTADITSFNNAVKAITVNNATNASKVSGTSFGSASTCASSAFLASSTKYALSSSVGGVASTAARLNNSSAIGDTYKPVYFNADGVPVACDIATASGIGPGTKEGTTAIAALRNGMMEGGYAYDFHTPTTVSGANHDYVVRLRAESPNETLHGGTPATWTQIKANSAAFPIRMQTHTVGASSTSNDVVNPGPRGLRDTYNTYVTSASWKITTTAVTGSVIAVTFPTTVYERPSAVFLQQHSGRVISCSEFTPNDDAFHVGLTSATLAVSASTGSTSTYSLDLLCVWGGVNKGKIDF